MTQTVRTRIVIILICILSLLGFPLTLQAKLSIKTAVFPFQPLVFTGTDGSLQGIFCDILGQIAAKEGWTIRYSQNSLAVCLDKLNAGGVDLLCPAVYSKEKEGQYCFSKQTVLCTWGQIYAQKSAPLQSIIDLAHKSLAVVKDDIHYQELRHIINQFNLDIKFVEVADYAAVFEAIDKKWVDAGVIDRLYATLNDQHHSAERTAVIFSPIELRFAAPKQNPQSQELLTIIDYYLEQFKSDERSVYHQSINQWLAGDEKWQFPLWLKWLLPCTGALLLMFVGSNIVLRARVQKKTAELSQKNQDLHREIAERRSAEEALKKERDFISAILDTEGALVAVLDRETRIVRFNHACEQVTGYTSGEICGTQTIELLTPPDRIAAIKAVFAKLRASRFEDSQSIHLQSAGEGPILTRDGHSRLIAWTNTLLLDKGQFEYLICTGIDITENRHAEDERLRLSTIVEQAIDGVVVCDEHASIQYANPAFEGISGFVKHELIGASPAFLFSASLDDACYAPVFDTDGRGKTWAGRMAGLKKDFTPFNADITISSIRDNISGIVNTVLFIRDVTHEVRLEKQLGQSQKMEAIGTLAGGIAHDFNNILGAILGYTELAMGSVSPGTAVYNYLEKLLKPCQRARDLVKQILAFSRQSDEERKVLQISSIIQETLQLLRASLPSTIEIVTNIHAANDTVMADQTQLHQVLLNLCTNAGHAMQKKGGVLAIDLSNVEFDAYSAAQHPGLRADTYVQLSVNDTGYGIPSSIRDRIFDPFFTTKRTGEGTGLGLSVVHGIVKKYDGAITVYSEPGKGTTFNVYLPVTKNSSQTAGNRLNPSPTGKGSILLVDDEETLVEIWQEMLVTLGYTVTGRTSSIEALKAFQAQPEKFDLVITDQTMPNMTGMELARELLHIRADIPIILCSGFSHVITPEALTALGIRTFITKPIIKRDLAEIIHKILRSAGQQEGKGEYPEDSICGSQAGTA